MLTKVYYPYYRYYRCIADSCPMCCCKYFRISFFKWEEKLFDTKPEWKDFDGNGSSIREYLGHDAEGWFCKDSSKGACTFWGSDGLCEVQKKFGAGAMPSVCRTYPRVVTGYPDRMEYALDACCPVVAASVWNWNTGAFITEGPPCDTPETGSLTAKRNSAMHMLSDESASLSDCLRQIDSLFECGVSIPDIILDKDKSEYMRRMSILLIWENILRHEHSSKGNTIMTLLLEFICRYSLRLGQTEFPSRWEMSVDFSKNYISFIKGTPIEPDDEDRFIDVIPE